jgi:hypothetical protein
MVRHSPDREVLAKDRVILKYTLVGESIWDLFKPVSVAGHPQILWYWRGKLAMRGRAHGHR